MRPDKHSYFDTSQPRLQHLRWNVLVDFDKKLLYSTAALTFNRGGSVVDLDTRDLEIAEVANSKNTSQLIDWELGDNDPIMGSRLRLTLPKGVRSVTVLYRTSPTAVGLQWLTPEQTTGGKKPFVFSQGEAINTRSYLPCQDSPAVRFTFEAILTVPAGLKAVVGADLFNESSGYANEGGNPNCVDYHWQMTRPIPAYLIAFAVGDLDRQKIGPRSYVWAEPKALKAAAREFDETELFIVTAEELFGKYRWGTFSILVMPKSFPYGGMENPTLTFVTPALVAGDRSMVDVIIHELMHHWFGNYITNATWEDFWLNEGWTMYAEGRVTEALDGQDVKLLNMALFGREFERDCQMFAKMGQPELTHLNPNLTGLNPDDVFSRVPYHKGHLFLVALEQAVGRRKFDRFIRKLLKRFAFKSITTKQFMRFLNAELPGAASKVEASAWLYGPNLPASAPKIDLPLIDEVVKLAMSGNTPDPKTVKWGNTTWALYLESLPRDERSYGICQELDGNFPLDRHPHADVRFAFLLFAVDSGYYLTLTGVVEEFLGQHGRVKYLKPLYGALAKKDFEYAKALFKNFKASYHPLAQVAVEKTIEMYDPKP